MAPLSGDWLEALKDEFHQPYYAKLYKTVMEEYRTRRIFRRQTRCSMPFILRPSMR